MNTHTQSESHALPEEALDAILHDYLVGDDALLDIASRHGVSLTLLARIVSSPEGRERLQALDDLLELRAAHKRRSTRRTAVMALQRIAATPGRSAESARKAATQLLELEEETTPEHVAAECEPTRVHAAPPPPEDHPPADLSRCHTLSARQRKRLKCRQGHPGQPRAA